MADDGWNGFLNHRSQTQIRAGVFQATGLLAIPSDLQEAFLSSSCGRFIMSGLARILKGWTGANGTTGRHGAIQSVRLALECLEDRTVPSTVITEIPLQ